MGVEDRMSREKTHNVKVEDNEMSSTQIMVDGEVWLTVATVYKRGGSGKNSWYGPDREATRARADLIAGGLRVRLNDKMIFPD